MEKPRSQITDRNDLWDEMDEQKCHTYGKPFYKISYFLNKISDILYDFLFDSTYKISYIPYKIYYIRYLIYLNKSNILFSN